MREIKMVVTDLDGTFIAPQEALEENIRAMKEAQAKGIRVYPCTGRAWHMAEGEIGALGFDPLCIVNNGASIVDMRDGTLQRRNRIAPDDVRRLLQIGAQHGVHAEISCTHGLALVGDTYREDDDNNVEFVHIARDMMQKGYVHLFSSDEEMLDECGEASELIRFFANPLDEPELVEALRGVEGAAVTQSYIHHIDVMAKGTSKGAMLSKLAAMLDMPLENIMVLGDQINDISMIEIAGIGVAMGNAGDAVKQVADVVTAPNTEAGFAKALREYVL